MKADGNTVASCYVDASKIAKCSIGAVIGQMEQRAIANGRVSAVAVAARQRERANGGICSGRVSAGGRVGLRRGVAESRILITCGVAREGQCPVGDILMAGGVA